MPKMIFSMKCRKSLYQKYGKGKSVGRAMYIFIGRIYAKNDEVYVQYAIIHGFGAYFIKCKKNLCQKYGKIKSVGISMYTIINFDKVGRIYVKKWY